MLDMKIRGGTVVDGSGAPAETADIGIIAGQIVECGRISTPARRTIVADGLLVTPGWVDIHTHYDGQATWDPFLDPSFSSGVTTAIVGNCGVGFAPIRPGQEERLIELMEGVEEIPGTALHAGLAWNWSSFTEYLDVLAERPRSFDIGALLPHGPLRLYAMGDKVGTDKCASGDELAAMTAMTGAAMQAGAFGLSSSRTPMHRSSTGAMTPDYEVDAPELIALAAVVAQYGGIIEFAPAGLVGEDLPGLRREMALYDRIVRETGVTLHMLVLQPNLYPDFWQEQLDWTDRITAGGRSRAFAQVCGRSISVLLSFAATHPFVDRPSFVAVRHLPLPALLETLADPALKARILAEIDAPGSWGEFLNAHWARCYDIGEDSDFEPDDDRSIASLAAGAGMSAAEFCYDRMLAMGRNPRLLLATTNYTDGKLDRLRSMMERPSAVLGASDAGAHVMTVCDGSMNSFMLKHWVRDRTRGPKMPVEQVVRMMTRDTANSIGITDRGVLAPGMRADLNLIDLDGLTMGPPRVVDDLPAGASRLLQDVRGYKATICNGTVTREDDQATGALPGGLLRKGTARGVA